MSQSTNARRIEIITSSGLLRVIIRPSLHWFWALVELGGIVFFAQFTARNWHTLSGFSRLLLLFGLGFAALSLIYVQTGREIIEFAPQRLTIVKDMHGWERKKEYGIEDCTELQVHDGSESHHNGLECKVKWRRITFGRNISENEAAEILAALQTTLPAVAKKLCSFQEHFTTLRLS
jgi:hypothetical protein